MVVHVTLEYSIEPLLDILDRGHTSHRIPTEKLYPADFFLTSGLCLLTEQFEIPPGILHNPHW
jgi:hypothetical protein